MPDKSHYSKKNKNMNHKIFLNCLAILIGFSQFGNGQDISIDLSGAWKADKGVIIFSGNYFSYAEFSANQKKYTGTYGGEWSQKDNKLNLSFEYNTFDTSLVGQSSDKPIILDENSLTIDKVTFSRIDNGSPGMLQGAWLFYGRKRDGELSTRDADQPRKTMKILSGTRFQWIAYNTETGQFSGTGGGTYTTIDNKYTESIDFFSRDASRVGAILTFDYEIVENVWYHSGLNSRGEPLYELWSKR